ncbi:MAG: CHAT domain-containing protein, partial [Acidobacteria bacterium]|nr:CHAT domain-containing protein [Acidobacteriota bacterium]
LVVLNSCETAVGRASAAEGMQSLARAFQLAGARTVVGTIWPVEDRVSRRFALALYDGLAAGATVGDAVRRAQLALARDEPYSSARQWAGFSVLGDPSLTLTLPPRNRGLAFIAPLLGLLLATIVVALVIRAWQGR